VRSYIEKMHQKKKDWCTGSRHRPSVQTLALQKKKERERERENMIL
jgi:hypothetical protein